MPEFAQPYWLILLAGLPLLLWWRWRSPRVESSFRKRASAVLRCTAAAAVILALAGPLSGTWSEHMDVVFALDVSHSVDRETTQESIDFINRALLEKPDGARMGLVVFGADTATEMLLRNAAEPLEDVSVDVERGATNIGRALEVAMSAFQADANRRIVLLSDGVENEGAARAAASVARSIGVEVSTIALPRRRNDSEVLLRNVAAPGWVRVNESFNLDIEIQSARETSAQLVVTRNGLPLGERTLQLRAGSNRVSVVEQVDDSGLYEYEAVINGERDSIAENNRFQTFVQVRGAPRVLHAVGDPGWGRHVTRALETQGIRVDQIAGTALPTSLHELTDYDLVILNNVPGFDVSFAKMTLLEDYVRDSGGGLITLGGDKSYSAGGYHGTPVERALPVTMDVRTEARIPTLAVTIVIDRSGSMASGDKLVIAKAAAVAAIEVMNPLDRVGVLAFDDDPEWSVQPVEVGSRESIIEQLRMVASGGGTNLYGALSEAHGVMLEQQSRVKHLIVLSDGLTETGEDFRGLVQKMVEDGITVSTVAFGSDADRSLMEAIAAVGKGRHYFTDNPRNVPRIFTSETLVVSRNLMVEEPTQPQLAYPGEALRGLAANGFPALAGYQRIFPKPAAQVLLSAGEDPLLVSWRYGLGRAAAFTSDLAGRWGADWVAWSEFPRFVSQLARWTMRRQASEKLLPQFSWRGERAEVLVDVLDKDDQFINQLDMRATVLDAQSLSQQIELEQVSPGRYRGEFQVGGSGRYYVNLHGEGADGRSVGPRTFGLAIPYSSEYLNLGVDRSLLEDLAQSTGGDVLPLSARALNSVLAPAADAVQARQRNWWLPVLLALLLLLLEIAVRKVHIPESWRWARAKRPADAEQDAGYHELVANIARVRERHLAALREGGRNDLDDPAVRARLYLARGRS